jgi:hypothetical protein
MLKSYRVIVSSVLSSKPAFQTSPLSPSSSKKRHRFDILVCISAIYGLNLMAKLINNIYESGQWLKDCIEVTMVALEKKPKAIKCTDHRTISLIAYAAKIVASVIRRRSEKKIEGKLGEDQFGFRK